MNAPSILQVFLFARHPTRRWLGASNALAVGLMLAASFGFVYEEAAQGLWRTLLGISLGLVCIVLTRSFIQKRDPHAAFTEMGSLDARKAVLIVGVMMLHSFTEGVGIGVSFGGGQDQGCSSAWPSRHTTSRRAGDQPRPRTPQGRGKSVSRAALWSHLLQPSAAAHGRPRRLEDTTANLVAVLITLSVAAMAAFQFLIR